MQFPYEPKALIPLSSYVDENGETQSVYQLPAPKNWVLRAPGIDVRKVVNKVRICLTTVGPQKEPAAVVVPFDEEDKEIRLGTLTFSGIDSIKGVLRRLGFTPVSPN